MMAFSCLFTILVGEPEPIRVQLGDPILDTQVRTVANETHALDSVFEYGFCFFLSLDCGFCLDAMADMKNLFPSDRHVVLLFRGEPSQNAYKRIQKILAADRFEAYLAH